MKRGFVFLALGVVAGTAFGEIGDVRLHGPLGERLDRMIERHVGGTDVDYITACFQEKTERKGWWQTEFWGKYMHAAVPFADYSASAKIRADVERGVVSSGRPATGRATRVRPSSSPSFGSTAASRRRKARPPRRSISTSRRPSPRA